MEWFSRVVERWKLNGQQMDLDDRSYKLAEEIKSLIVERNEIRRLKVELNYKKYRHRLDFLTRKIHQLERRRFEVQAESEDIDWLRIRKMYPEAPE